MHVVPVKLAMSVPDPPTILFFYLIFINVYRTIEIKKAIITNPHNLEYVLEAIYNPQAFGTIAVLKKTIWIYIMWKYFWFL